MAKINFDNGTVWDNTLAGDAKYSTKVPGHAGQGREVRGIGGSIRGLTTAGKRPVVLTGTFDFDSSYPTGGEDITALWDAFPGGVLSGALFTQPNVAAVRTVSVDTGNKKLLGYTDGLVTQVTNGTNLSAVTGLRWVAWGY
jgi:hypothetical protein